MREKEAHQFVLVSVSAALITSVVALLISIYTSIVLYNVRIEQLKRTKHVYDVQVLEERISQLESRDEILWRTVDQMRTTADSQQ